MVLIISMKNFTRTFSYVQIISLAGFQIILFFIFLDRLADAENSIYRPQTALRFILPPDDSDKSEFGKKFSGSGALKNWKQEKKIFIRVDLTGELAEDKKRIDVIRNEAMRLKYTNDTTHILKVHFTEDNTYGQIVELVNIMNKDRHKRYMFYKDDFYILGESPPE